MDLEPAITYVGLVSDQRKQHLEPLSAPRVHTVKTMPSGDVHAVPDTQRCKACTKHGIRPRLDLAMNRRTKCFIGRRQPASHHDQRLLASLEPDVEIAITISARRLDLEHHTCHRDIAAHV